MLKVLHDLAKDAERDVFFTDNDLRQSLGVFCSMFCAADEASS